MKKYTDLAWIAGFLDGEGCFTVAVSRQGRKFDPKIAVTQKDKRPISKLLTTIGGRTCIDGRGFHKWTLSGATQLRRVLPLLIPYLVLKKDQAELLLVMCNGMHIRGNRRVTDEEIRDRQWITAQLKVLKR